MVLGWFGVDLGEAKGFANLASLPGGTTFDSADGSSQATLLNDLAPHLVQCS